MTMSFRNRGQTPRALKTSGLLAALLTAALVAASCGGGGGGTTATANSVVVATTDSFGNTIGTDPLAGFGIDGGSGGGFGAGDSGGDGTGGEGPPLVGAAVLVTDSAGKTATAITNADGYYRVKITGMKEPLVVRMVGQNGKVYTSMRADAIKTGFNTINVTSFTDKIASNLAIAAGKQSAAELLPANVTAAAINTEQNALKAALLPALTDAGASTVDFITTPFKADGTSIDKVLDLVRHEITSDGSTKLFTKKPSTDSTTGAVTSAELSSSNPLPVGDVNDLDFAKLKAFQSVINACLAAPSSNCPGIVHDSYKNNSMSFDEQLDQVSARKRYNTVLTAADTMKNAVFEVPELLAKFESALGSGVFDVAVVELRWFQPHDNSYRTMITNARRFPGYLNPGDGNIASKIGGDWWLYGNQRAFDAGIYMRTRQQINLNPSTNNGTNTNKLSFHMAGMGASINSYMFNPATSQWVNANIRAVNVTGPGLPPNGLMYSPLSPTQTCVGSTSIVGANSADYHGLTGINQSTFPASATFATDNAGNSAPHYWLKRSRADGSLLNLPNGSASISNLAPYKAWNVYRFVVQKNDLSTVTFTARNVAAVLDTDAMTRLPLHDVSAVESMLTAPQGAVANVSFNWVNNPAMPGAVYSWAVSRAVATNTVTYNSEKRFARSKTSLSSASSVSLAASDVSQWSGCNASGNTHVLSALDSTTNTHREWNLRTNYNRVGIDQIRVWRN